jgi:hypothetical protein
MAGCCSKRLLKTAAAKPVNPKRGGDDDGSTGKSRLKRVDLTGTSIDFKGLEALLRNCKSLVTVSVDDDLW